MKRWHKKAITVIMASAILVTFAIAVGSVVMGFGSAEVEEQARCAIEVGLKIAQIGGQEQLCYDTGKKELSYTLENGVNIKVEGLVVNVVGSSKAASQDVNEAKMPKAGTYVGHFPYDATVNGEIRQVKIVPKVVYADVEEVCSEQALMSEKVQKC